MNCFRNCGMKVNQRSIEVDSWGPSEVKSSWQPCQMNSDAHKGGYGVTQDILS